MGERHLGNWWWWWWGACLALLSSCGGEVQPWTSQVVLSNGNNGLEARGKPVGVLCIDESTRV